MKHIALVEDDSLNAAMMRKILEKRGGYRVSVTEDPAELMKWAEAGDVALIIMDVSLSQSRWENRPVNGTDLCRILKANPRTAAVPVILATAHAMRGDAEALLAESGADGYVSKPIIDHAAFISDLRRRLEDAA